MRPSEHQAAPSGIQRRLAAPGGRTRAAGTRTATVHPQFGPGHSPGIHSTSGTAH